MLNQIIATKIDELEVLSLPEEKEFSHVSLYEAIKQPNRQIGLIAEIKKASPSKGIIKEDFRPLEIANGYEKGGADAISILTDQIYFKGHRDYLTAVKQAVNLPILRKDFIISPLQIEESVRIGADAILLIGGIFEAERLHELYELAYEKGLECLVEVHSEAELEELLSVFTPKIIGVNNRNLKTFTTSLEQTKKMADLLPKDSLYISESGIHTKKDVDFITKAGANGMLVGESLMRASTPEQGIVDLFGGNAVDTPTA
ncbi:indole-3-glycerol phosphate synthase TrpC [Anaerobacillus sp. MEB173]|uniref:indole-3-glycerol phosphate synthase TrpC n=1 Tax=Anaerobacillus sp. MEB173 TaxID=3383345 RepID=UPI003F8E542F